MDEEDKELGYAQPKITPTKPGITRSSKNYGLHPSEHGFISGASKGLRDKADPNDPATQPSEVRIIKPGKN